MAMKPTGTAEVARKIWALLAPSERRAAIVLLGLTLAGTILEMLGVGLIVPTVALLTQADIGAKFPALRPVLARLGNPTQLQLVMGGLLILAGVFLFKAVFMGFVVWRQMRFVFAVQAHLSQRLFAGYLRQPYIFHLQRNSAQLIQNLTTEVSAFTFNIMLPGLILLTEGFVVVGFAALLLVIEPLGALIVVSVLGIAAGGFHHLTRQRVMRWGEARHRHEGLRVQHVQQGLGGAKDVKLLGRETEFLEQYRVHNEQTAHVGERQLTLQQLPRLWLEVLAVCGLVLLVLSMLSLGRPIDALLPTLGLFAAAAFRLMPSINRILNSAQSLRFGLPVINTLHSELEHARNLLAPVCRPIEPFRESIAFCDVEFAYPGSAKAALQKISLTIQRGECVGFIGTSGAGKSTLVDIVLGLLAPNNGTVRVDGKDIRGSLRNWQDQLGYVPQSIYLTDDTLLRNVAFGLAAAQIDSEAVWRALDAAQLADFVRSLPEGLQTTVGERGIRLSGGQRQRIGIARALYHDPAVLVLDEATSSLDPSTEHGVMEAVRQLAGSKTIIVVAHRLSTVEYCTRLFRLERGRIADHGSYESVTGAASRLDAK